MMLFVKVGGWNIFWFIRYKKRKFKILMKFCNIEMRICELMIEFLFFVKDEVKLKKYIYLIVK